MTKKELKEKYEEVRAFNEGLAVVRNGEKFGVINRQNELIFPLEYDGIFSFHLGYAISIKNKKFGILNILGEEVFPCEYDALSVVTRSRKIWLEKNGEYIEHQLPKLTIKK